MVENNQKRKYKPDLDGKHQIQQSDRIFVIYTEVFQFRNSIATA